MQQQSAVQPFLAGENIGYATLPQIGKIGRGRLLGQHFDDVGGGPTFFGERRGRKRQFAFGVERDDKVAHRPAFRFYMVVEGQRLWRGGKPGHRSIGVTAPVIESGDIAGSGACKIIGPKGEIEISEGVIAAKRHIHATPEDAKALGVENGQIVSVKLDTEGRSLIFGVVVVRITDSYALAMHIDTDESNAAGCGREVYGEIVK